MQIQSVLLVMKHFMLAGTERYTVNLARSLADLGIEVTILAGPGPYLPHIPFNIKTVAVPIDGSNRQIKNKASDVILQTALKVKPQLIHTQCRNSLICSQKARNELNLPIVSSEHLTYNKKDFSFVAGQLEKFADKVITIGDGIAGNFVRYGLNKDKINVIYNGVDYKEFPLTTIKEKLKARKLLNLKHSDKIILCISRIVEGKEIDKLIEAFVLIKQSFLQAKLLIVGDDQGDGTLKIIKKKIESLGLTDEVRIYTSTYDIRIFHMAADVFCYPAIAKGMAVMEAMSSGLPIVGKKPVNKPDVVEDKISGYLLNSSDHREIAGKIILLLQNPEKSREMGMEGRKAIIKNFNLDNVVSKTVSVYGQLLDEKAGNVWYDVKNTKAMKELSLPS
ncbi:MAG: glycosyltransferase family 4 protein [Patescibacteria group bacterium]|nr:glycosyltransferase family 4 protein [Patescibacteria group bacterium]